MTQDAAGFSQTDIDFMNQALRLSAFGTGSTAPILLSVVCWSLLPEKLSARVGRKNQVARMLKLSPWLKPVNARAAQPLM